MTTFDQVLLQSTARGANNIPGCVLAAVDKNGQTLYSKAAGFSGVAPNAEPISPDATFWMASCTKLLGTIAALQCVERGQISLDEPVRTILPELKEPERFLSPAGNGDGASPDLTTVKTSNEITLRQLLCHTSGISYDIFTPILMAWRASRKEGPQSLGGSVADAHSCPLVFEPGEGWAYSGGIDWAGLLVARLNHTTVEEYFQKHIYTPLGMTSTTFRLEKHPEIKSRLVNMAERTEDGNLKEAEKPWPDFAAEDCAGAGLYSTAGDYIKVLGDLIKEEPTLLKRETVEREMFTPQLQRDSKSHAGLLQSTDILGAMTGALGQTPKSVNWALGGMFIGEELGAFRANTLVWGGYPNLTWFANREHGIAGIYASQVIPPGDAKSVGLAQSWIKEVWRVNEGQ